MDKNTDADDILFSPVDPPPEAVRTETEPGWDTGQDDWQPTEGIGDIESLLTDEPGFGETMTHALPGESEEPSRNLIGLPDAPGGMAGDGSAGQAQDPFDSNSETARLAALAGETGMEELPGSGPRQALPTLRDAPVHPIRVGMEARPVAWIMPLFILFVGGGTGAAVYTLGENPVLGGLGVALSLVGALFVRVLMRS